RTQATAHHHEHPSYRRRDHPPGGDRTLVALGGCLPRRCRDRGQYSTVNTTPGQQATAGLAPSRRSQPLLTDSVFSLQWAVAVSDGKACKLTSASGYTVIVGLWEAPIAASA